MRSQGETPRFLERVTHVMQFYQTANIQTNYFKTLNNQIIYLLQTKLDIKEVCKLKLRFWDVDISDPTFQITNKHMSTHPCSKSQRVNPPPPQGICCKQYVSVNSLLSEIIHGTTGQHRFSPAKIFKVKCTPRFLAKQIFSTSNCQSGNSSQPYFGHSLCDCHCFLQQFLISSNCTSDDVIKFL